jgi:hypothetical protein
MVRGTFSSCSFPRPCELRLLTWFPLAHAEIIAPWPLVSSAMTPLKSVGKAKTGAGNWQGNVWQRNGDGRDFVFISHPLSWHPWLIPLFSFWPRGKQAPMKQEKPSDPETLDRVVRHLAEIGWVKRANLAYNEHTASSLAYIDFTDKGQQFLGLLDKFQDGLGDIEKRDRHFMYDLLVTLSFENRRRNGLS